MSILPQLRSDLSLDSTATFIDGQATYLLTDPIKNTYYRLNKKTLLILQNWQQMSAEELLETLNKKYDIVFSEEDLKQTLQFLMQNQLLVSANPEMIQSILQSKQQKRGRWLNKIIHHYLFFKIPLFKPDRFLSITAPYVSKLFSRGYVYFMLGLFFIGFYLTLQQWDAFFQSFDYFFSITGAVYIFVAMALVKSFHELGHAYAAKYYGCHVNAIGVAFLVLFPILYTDTSDAWRLKNPKHRLIIDCAGVIAELHMMIWFMLLWHLVDSAVLKSIFVYAITVGLISTLLVNLNPLMRFDGYYALSNFLHIDNLQPHGFALARWKLRYWLIGLDEPAPFNVSAKKLKIMLIYAYVTWMYRFVVFVGIAFMVYYLFFKVLGILLFLVEVYYFILGPIVSELIVYFKHIQQLKFNTRIASTASVLTFILILLIFPWRTTLVVPAVMTFALKKDIYTHVDSFADSIPNPNRSPVLKDKAVFVAKSPELVFEMQLTKLKIKALKTKILQQQGLGKELGAKQADISELHALENQLENIKEEQDRLSLSVPYNGFIYNRAPNILPHRWYKANSYLFSIAQPNTWAVRAYIPEYELSRIEDIKDPVFLSDLAATPPIALALIQKPLASIESLENPYLASQYQGSLPVYAPTEKSPKLLLKESYYEFVFAPIDHLDDIHFEQRGVLIMKVARESYIKRFIQHVIAILIRESTFS